MKAAVIILNWNGEKLLQDFLPSVIKNTNPALGKVVVADNASTDRSLEVMRAQFPEVEVVVLDKNYGFAGGYNRVIAGREEDVVVLLNSDVEVAEGWLEPLLEALERYVQQPDVMFEYKYITEEAPAKVVKRTMSQKKDPHMAGGKTPAAGKSKKKSRRHSVFLPVLLGITVAFMLACGALCYMILRNADDPLLNTKAEIILEDYVGATRSEVEASPQVSSGQIVIEWVEEYNSTYGEGYVYKQSPTAGRTVREGQSITLTVSLGTQYVSIPDLTNYVQADAEQVLQELGV